MGGQWRGRRGRGIGVAIAVALLASSCSQSTEATLSEEQAAAQEVVVNSPSLQRVLPTDARLDVHHLPLVIDVDGPTISQRYALANADVPVGTVVPVPTVTADGTPVHQVRIAVVDVMAEESSYQRISVDLVGGNDATEPSVQQLESDKCSPKDSIVTKVRDDSTACMSTDASRIVWREAGRIFEAKMADASVVSTLQSWVESLRMIEMGSAGYPYRRPFCAADPARCAG